MRQRFVRAGLALVTAGTLVGGAVTAAQSAAAVEPGIRKPELRVVCAQPHHGNHFTAVRFVQHGKWVAGGKVRATISRGLSTPPTAVLHTTTGPHGWFHLRRILVSDGEPAWVRGASYSWTTSISGDTWAFARRGNVTLTGSC
jgi:hypothetical protein